MYITVYTVIQAFGICLTLGMGTVMNTYGTFASNSVVAVALLVGTIATSMSPLMTSKLRVIPSDDVVMTSSRFSAHQIRLAAPGG